MHCSDILHSHLNLREVLLIFMSDSVPWLQNEFAFGWGIIRLPSYHTPQLLNSVSVESAGAPSKSVVRIVDL